MINIAELRSKKEKIQNEIPLLLEWVSPSSRILIAILEFHSKSRSRFGLLSSAYLTATRLSLLELKMNDIQEKISSHV